MYPLIVRSLHADPASQDSERNKKEMGWLCTRLLFPHMYAVKQHSSRRRYELSSTQSIPLSFCDTTHLPFKPNCNFSSHSGLLNFMIASFSFFVHNTDHSLTYNMSKNTLLQ